MIWHVARSCSFENMGRVIQSTATIKRLSRFQDVGAMKLSRASTILVEVQIAILYSPLKFEIIVRSMRTYRQDRCEGERGTQTWKGGALLPSIEVWNLYSAVTRKLVLPRCIIIHPADDCVCRIFVTVGCHCSRGWSSSPSLASSKARPIENVGGAKMPSE